MSAPLDAGAPLRGAPPRVTGLFFAGLTLVSGLFGVGFWVARDPGPEASLFPPAAAQVRADFAPGDLLVLAPFYATRPREHLGDLRPVTPRDPLTEDLLAHRRVWVFGLFGAGLALRDVLPQAGLLLEAPSEPSPGITVDRYRVTSPWQVVYDFRVRLRDARVFHEHTDGVIEPCDRWDPENNQSGAQGRWVCPHDSEWFNVADEWHYMDEQLRACLWAHPPNGGRLLIRYPNVPMTGHLYGRAGHTLNGSVHAKERIDFDVAIGGQGSQRFVFPLEDHFRPFAVSTPTVGTATVTFAVSSPDAGANHFCFVADLRRPTSPEIE